MLKTIKTKQHHIIMREVLISHDLSWETEWEEDDMPNNSQYLQRNNFLYFSWEKLTSNWGKKIANFWKGEPPNIGCI